VRQLPALFQPQDTSPQLAGPYPGKNATRGYLVGEDEDVREDSLQQQRRRISDYLQDVANAIKTDGDIMDPVLVQDQLTPVKTIRTDDGHEIKIVGNEDDGFRVSIRDRQGHTRFNNLDEAVMACEMYCARRRQRRSSQDYIEEA
jgi:hypothetical protein